MNEDVNYRVNGNLTKDERATIENGLSKYFAEQERNTEVFSSPLPENLQQFSIQAKEWLAKNWFGPAGIDQSEIQFPEYVRDKKLQDERLGEAPVLDRAVYVDITILEANIEDPDIRDYMAGRVILEEIYHHTGMRHLNAVVETADNGDATVNATYESGGFSFFRKNGDFNLMEEGMAQLLVESAKSLLKEQFPRGYEKIEKNRREEVKDYEVFMVKDREISFAPAHQQAKALAKQVLSDLGDNRGLLERSRIKGEHLPLARKLKEVYGESLYRRIMTTGKGEVKDLTKMLADKAAQST